MPFGKRAGDGSALRRLQGRGSGLFLCLRAESHKIFCLKMKKTPDPIPHQGPSARRTFEKLEIEDGDRRAGLGVRLRRLFRRKDSPRARKRAG